MTSATLPDMISIVAASDKTSFQNLEFLPGPLANSRRKLARELQLNH
jgi:hypothetical protein